MTFDETRLDVRAYGTPTRHACAVFVDAAGNPSVAATPLAELSQVEYARTLAKDMKARDLTQALDFTRSHWVTIYIPGLN